MPVGAGFVDPIASGHVLIWPLPLTEVTNMRRPTVGRGLSGAPCAVASTTCMQRKRPTFAQLGSPAIESVHAPPALPPTSPRAPLPPVVLQRVQCEFAIATPFSSV